MTDRPASASMQIAEPTHQMQIAWIVTALVGIGIVAIFH